MLVHETPIPGLFVIEPRCFTDNRGFFLEIYRDYNYLKLGIIDKFVQDNHSRSKRHVIRGLHFQKKNSQAKLVYVPFGEVFDVSVDLRNGSPTYGKWYGVVISDINHLQVYVPAGFAHGICVLSDTADLLYKCTDIYHPEDEGGILWNDPDLQIRWPVDSPILSVKDMKLKKFSDISEQEFPKIDYRL